MDLGLGVMVLLVVNNIILWGCELKNIVWVFGVVVYVGREIKVMLNSVGV